jgi:hypothetical protein
MLLIVFLDLMATLTLVSSECNVGNPNLDDFDWTKVGVSLLTGIVKGVVVVVET